ncbi:hypothetical protein [Nonlabens sp. Asnod3-A02]|uniref:hypothetical protein n=1 Tax=Nonlabens sp. Asnod3-A02 TaxID=3160579 RepID=UPI003867F434
MIDVKDVLEPTKLSPAELKKFNVKIDNSYQSNYSGLVVKDQIKFLIATSLHETSFKLLRERHRLNVNLISNFEDSDYPISHFPISDLIKGEPFQYDKWVEFKVDENYNINQNISHLHLANHDLNDLKGNNSFYFSIPFLHAIKDLYNECTLNIRVVNLNPSVQDSGLTIAFRIEDNSEETNIYDFSYEPPNGGRVAFGE